MRSSGEAFQISVDDLWPMKMKLGSVQLHIATQERVFWRGSCDSPLRQWDTASKGGPKALPFFVVLPLPVLHEPPTRHDEGERQQPREVDEVPR
jgi:hypothetical protein